MIERRLKEPTEKIEYKDLLGAKVRVVKLSMTTGKDWNEPGNKVFTVGDIGFRISTDGKCHTVIELVEKPGLLFSLGDLVICRKQ